MHVVIPTNLVRILFDPAIPTSSFNSFNYFYTCYTIIIIHLGTRASTSIIENGVSFQVVTIS